MNRQITVEASTHGGDDTSLLSQQLHGRLELLDSLRTSTRVRLASIRSMEEALLNLGTFAFVVLHLSSAGRWHLSAIAELLCIIERLEDLHTKFQEMISSPHLSMTLISNLPWQWSLYVNMCVAVLASEQLDDSGYHVLLLLDPIMAELEGGDTWASFYRSPWHIWCTRLVVEAVAAVLAATEATAEAVAPPSKKGKPLP